jgi:hypothetical protein
VHDELVKRITGRIKLFFEEGNPRLVLDPEAVHEAMQLWQIREVDAGTLSLLSWLHWSRYLSMPHPQNSWDGQVVAEYSFVLRYIHPDLVIEPVREAVANFRPSPGDTSQSLIRAVQADLEEIAAADDYQPGGRFGILLGVLNRVYNAAEDYAESRAAALGNISFALQQHYLRRGLEAYSDAAIQAAWAAAEALPADDPQRAVYLVSLSSALMFRHERAGDREVLDEAIEACREAARISPNREILKSSLINLDTALTTRLKLTDDPADHDAIIPLLRKLVELYPGDDPQRREAQAMLYRAHFDRYERTAELADLDATIRFGREAAADLPAGDPSKPTTLHMLAYAYQHRHDHAHDPDDLDAAIRFGAEAAACTPADAEGRAATLTNLGGAFQMRYRLHGRMEDLAEAIRICGAAAAESSAEASDRGKALSMLGTSLLARYERSGDIEDLNQAIQHCREGANIVPADATERAKILSNLGVSYSERFTELGLMEDLSSAITALKEAAELAPNEALIRSMLGEALRTSYGLFKRVEDLDAAVDNLRAAAEATQPTDPELPGMLSVYGAGMLARYEAKHDRADLEAAIDACRRAAEATSADHRYRAVFLTRLGAALLARYDTFGRSEDLDETIQVYERATSAISSTDSSGAYICTHLADALHKRGRDGDFESAVSAWRKATGFASSPAETRLEAAYHWADAVAEQADWPQAANAFATAVELLPLAIWQGLDRTSQQIRLMRWPYLATEAAACAIAAERLEQAVELLEHGRSVLWSHALNLRTDLADLREQHPELAARLDALRAELEHSPSDLVQPPQGEAERRWKAAREWDDLLARIRTFPGHETFLVPPSFAQLAPAGIDGPVVVVNLSRYRCDALAVTGSGVRLIPLRTLRFDEARQRTEYYLNTMNELSRGLVATADGARIIQQTLEWLWETVAQPVLTELGFSQAPDRDWPRVWWCPTGPLTLVPLHAAGYHGASQPGASVLDRVISSYTPTLRTLIRARRTPQVPDALRRLLVVAVPGSPHYAEGAAPLPGAAEEADLLAGRLGDRQTPLIDVAATRANVLGDLPSHAYVHFACHGGQALSHPAQGALFLYDAPLRVFEVSQLDLPNAELAFLSACQTAIGGALLPDESIHLAAALQLVGYRHVIATLWSIAAQPAPEVADKMWSMIIERGQIDPALSAGAVHTVVRAFRDLRPHRPNLWAPYVHVGP